MPSSRFRRVERARYPPRVPPAKRTGTRMLRGAAREEAIVRLSREFVDGARFFDAQAAVQAAISAIDDAVQSVARIPTKDGKNPLGEEQFIALIALARHARTVVLDLFPRGEPTLATLGWTYSGNERPMSWPQRWMEIATSRPAGHPDSWPWPQTWPASVAREAALRGKRWLLETTPQESAWVEYKDGCRETIEEVRRRTGAVGPWMKWTCRHRHRVRAYFPTPPPPPLRPAMAAALREEVGPGERMKKRAQRRSR